MKQFFILILSFYCLCATVAADQKAPDRTEGKGPYKRLILRGGIIVNGEGAPARGPMDIVIENDRYDKDIKRS